MRIIDFKESKCMHCYKCVRYCDVKAVMIKDGRAEVIEDKCVLCGHCLHVCPQSAKTMASDLDTVKYYICLLYTSLYEVKREGRNGYRIG